MRSRPLSQAFGIRLLFDPVVQRLVLAVLLVTLLVFRAFQFLYLSDAKQWGYDLSFYWRAGQNLLAGVPIYAPFQLAGPYPPQGVDYEYLYPPFLAAVVAPLAGVIADHRVANWLWAALGSIVLASTVVGLVRTERLPRFVPIWALIALAFAYAPVVAELLIGNVHLLILGLLGGAWLALERRSETGDVVAGALVGVAALIKVFPGLVILWFLLTGRFRAAAAAFAAAALLTLATVPFTGLQAWLDYPTVLANLGPPTELTDVLAPTVFLSEVMSPLAARLVVTAIGLATVTWVSLRRDPAVSFAVTVVVSLLIAPALYPHYLVVLVLPLLLALGRVPIGLLALVYFSSVGGEAAVFGEAAWIVNRALPTLGAMLLIVALVWFDRPRSDQRVLPSQEAMGSSIGT